MLNEKILKKEMNNAINWMKDYVDKSNAKGVVIGNSGGKDSSTVIAMAKEALGKDRVLTIYMPCSSASSDFEDAKLVSKTFDVRFISVDLNNTFREMEKSINIELNKMDIKDLSYEAKVNMKPRLRMNTLYSIAQTLGYLVAGTGNLSEAMVGYTTKWGDSGYDFNPIGNFTVNEVLEIGKILGVPKKILSKAPSDGLGGQTDEEKMGIKYLQIEEMIETGNTNEDAKKEILKRFELSKHKREKAPVYKFERINYLLKNYK